MRLLKNCSKIKLIACGYECDIYQIGEDIVYKHYPECKKCPEERRGRWKFLKKINHPNIEKIIDYDNEGFITYKNDFTMGTYLIYSPRFYNQTKIAINELKKIDNMSHNDILPSNMMYNKKFNSIILIDWTQHYLEPETKTLKDSIRMKRWEHCNENKDPKWFKKPSKKAIAIEIKERTLEHCVLQRNLSYEYLMLNINRFMKKVKNVYEIDEKETLKGIKKWCLWVSSGIERIVENIKIQNKIMGIK